MLNCLFSKVASIICLPSNDDVHYLPSCDDIITGGPWLASPALELTVLDRTSQVATLTTGYRILLKFFFCNVLFLTINFSMLSEFSFAR